MIIKGIFPTEAHKISPQQWVNIYQFTITGEAEFYDCCQVKDLDLDDPYGYGLELIDQEKVLSQGEAVK